MVCNEPGEAARKLARERESTARERERTDRMIRLSVPVLEGRPAKSEGQSNILHCSHRPIVLGLPRERRIWITKIRTKEIRMLRV